jgi:hypothetical protein
VENQETVNHMRRYTLAKWKKIYFFGTYASVQCSAVKSTMGLSGRAWYSWWRSDSKSRGVKTRADERDPGASTEATNRLTSRTVHESTSFDHFSFSLLRFKTLRRALAGSHPHLFRSYPLTLYLSLTCFTPHHMLSVSDLS